VMFDIILEGNAIQVVKEINSDSQPLNRFGHFIEGIRSALSSLRSFHVVYVRRETNLVAYFLAREAVTHVINSIWLEKTPPIIYDIVHRECIVLQC
jgi:hypothetical protein